VLQKEYKESLLLSERLYLLIEMLDIP